ncbi:hypothetical protein F5051DRAFT_457210 [Lentinula edodes]|nr:hypothetical protein F5051DRAFT_457210 [Lentinula edodes]
MRSAIIAITLLLHLSCHFQSVVGFPINLWSPKNSGSAQDMNVYVPVSAPPPALSMEHESKKFKIQIYSDKSCETYSGTFEGEIENGQEENVDTPKGKCLWFVLPFPSGCKLHLERKTGQIQQFGREYSAGTMLRGSFERIGIKCGQKDYSAKNKNKTEQPGR